MTYADGTSLEFSQPWGFTCKGKALCPDGKVRAFKGGTADTFFSLPVSICARGTRVAGFIMTETREGFSTATDDDPAVVKFVPYTYRKNWRLVSGEENQDVR